MASLFRCQERQCWPDRGGEWIKSSLSTIVSLGQCELNFHVASNFSGSLPRFDIFLEKKPCLDPEDIIARCRAIW